MSRRSAAALVGAAALAAAGALGVAVAQPPLQIPPADQAQPPAPPATPPVPGAPPEETAPATPPSPTAEEPPAPAVTPPPAAPSNTPPPELPADEAQEEPEAPPPPPPPRPRRARASFQALDKVTAETVRFDAPVGQPVRYKTLVFTVRACEVTTPEEAQPDQVANLDVVSAPPATRGREAPPPKTIYRGWMFASSPALHPLEHPVYDVWLTGCSN